MSLGQATKPRWSDRIRPWASLAVTLVLLAWVTQRIDASEVLARIAGGSLGWLSLAAGLMVLQIGLGAARWHRVSTQLELPMSRRHALEEYGLGVLLNQVLPGGVAGDAVRVWRHRSGHGSLRAPLRAALIDRVVGHWAHLLLTVIGLALWPVVHGEGPPAGSVPLLAVWCAAFAVVWWKPVLGLRALVSDTRIALRRGTDWVFHVSVSVALVLALLLSVACCAVALDLPLGWGMFTAIPLMLLVMVIPISVGGWGLREISAVVVLTTLGWSTTESIALSAAIGLTSLVGALPFIGVVGRSP